MGKIICPHCGKFFYEDSRNHRKVILDYIKEHPNCTMSNLHYEIRIAQKNVWVWIKKLEEEGVISVNRDTKGKKYYINLR